MTNKRNLIFLFAISILFTACFLDTKTKEEKNQEELEEALEELGDNLENVAEGISSNVEGGVTDALKGVEKALSGLKDGGDGEVKEPVNFRKLKEFLPESFNGMDRSDYKGSTTGMSKFKASVAKAKYKDDNQSIQVEITDAGGLGSALMGMAAWSSLQIDEESDDGYKRTTEFDGHKALEENNTKRQRSSLNMIVGDRFIVTMRGRKVDIDDLKKLAKKMDLDDLADLE